MASFFVLCGLILLEGFVDCTVLHLGRPWAPPAISGAIDSFGGALPHTTGSSCLAFVRPSRFFMVSDVTNKVRLFPLLYCPPTEIDDESIPSLLVENLFPGVIDSVHRDFVISGLILLRAQKSTISCVSWMPPVFDPASAFLYSTRFI